MVESISTPVSPISAPKGPREVVESFLRLTIDQPDLKKAKLHLSKRSVASGMMEVSAVPPGSTYTLGAEAADELGKRIPVSVKSPVPGSAGLQEMTVPVIVVQEEGEWKIDLPATMERLLGGVAGAMGQAMSAVGESMASAMSSVLTTAFGGDALPTGAAPASTPTPKPAPAKAVKVPVKKPVQKSVKKPAPKKKAAKKVVKKPIKKVAKKAAKKRAPKPVKKSAARKVAKKKRR